MERERFLSSALEMNQRGGGGMVEGQCHEHDENRKVELSRLGIFRVIGWVESRLRFTSLCLVKKEVGRQECAEETKTQDAGAFLGGTDVMRLTCSPAVASNLRGPATCGKAAFCIHTGTSGIFILDAVLLNMFS